MAVSTFHTKDNKYRLVFWKEEPYKTHIQLGNFETLEEAENEANKAEIEFYSKNTFILPKGVIIKGNHFELRIKADLINGNLKPRIIASAKTLGEIKDKRKEIIMSLI